MICFTSLDSDLAQGQAGRDRSAGFWSLVMTVTAAMPAAVMSTKVTTVMATEVADVVTAKVTAVTTMMTAVAAVMTAVATTVMSAMMTTVAAVMAAVMLRAACLDAGGQNDGRCDRGENGFAEGHVSSSVSDRRGSASVKQTYDVRRRITVRQITQTCELCARQSDHRSTNRSRRHPSWPVNRTPIALFPGVWSAVRRGFQLAEVMRSARGTNPGDLR